MMKMLSLEEGDFITVRSAKLSRGTYVKFQPHSTSFLEISNPKAVLEHTLRDFSALTKGDEILIKYINKDYFLTVLEIQPSFPENSDNAVSIVETDIEVDFAPDSPTRATPNTTSPTTAIPIPTTSSPVSSSPSTPNTTASSFTPFVGSGYRLDGKTPAITTTSNSTTTSKPIPIGSKTKNSSSSVSPTVNGNSFDNSKPKLIFGGNPSKPTAPPQEEQKASFVAFSGQGYSFREKNST